MSDTYAAVIRGEADARAVFLAAMAHARAMVDNDEGVLVSVGPAVEPIGIRQRKFLHGPVLGQVSEQVRVEGERYVMPVWKEFFRNLFLGYGYEMRSVPRWDDKLKRLVRGKRKVPFRYRKSTEDLGVKRYSEYIDKVLAHASVEFGVEFVFDDDEREAVRYVAPRRITKTTKELEHVEP